MHGIMDKSHKDEGGVAGIGGTCHVAVDDVGGSSDDATSVTLNPKY